MNRHIDPIELFHTGLQAAFLVAETQMVIALRVMGLAGFWSVSPSEKSRMVAEKGPAFAKSAQAMMGAAAHGHRPDQIMSAGMKPLRHKTKSNATRLAKRGLKRK